MHRQTKFKTGASSLLFTLMVMLAGGAVAGISTTKHNLSTTGTGTVHSTDQTEICIFCHTPHDAIKNDAIPLWNHNLSTVTTYGVYTSPTMNANMAGADLGGVTAATAAVSNLCLSCHDGSVAINSLNNPSNVNPTTTMVGTTADGKLLSSSSTNLGSAADALKNDHPVNFPYNATLFTDDGTLKDPSTLTGVKLFATKVQCASCHDVHSSTNGAFLRMSMSGSSLCFACHNK